MSSSDRRAFLILLAGAPLAACGFTPAFAPGGPAATLRGGLRPDDPTDKNSFNLVSEIENRLGRADTPRFLMSYKITTHTTGVGITTSNAITRYDLIGTVTYTVRDAATGKVLTQGSADSFTSYSAAGTPVSTLTDEDAANASLMTILADQLVTQLVASAGTWAK
ncbi:MAG: hypothetical protein GC186_16945 [Rhodobacteraceae bacterium]|nr:hypothetical protein [Paracoccaceae bacterium]